MKESIKAKITTCSVNHGHSYMKSGVSSYQRSEMQKNGTYLHNRGTGHGIVSTPAQLKIGAVSADGDRYEFDLLEDFKDCADWKKLSGKRVDAIYATVPPQVNLIIDDTYSKKFIYVDPDDIKAWADRARAV